MGTLRLLLHSTSGPARALSSIPDAAHGEASQPEETSLSAVCPRVHGLLLDVRGVLYDDAAWNRWLWQRMRQMGVCTSFSCWLQVWQSEYEPRGLDEATYWQALRRFFRACGMSIGQVDEVEAACHAKWWQLHQTNRPLTGVQAALGRLCELSLPLGIASTAPWSCVELRQQMERLGLSPCLGGAPQFECSGALEDRVTRLRQQCRQWQLAPSQVAYVARESLALRAAQQAGLLPLALHTENVPTGAIGVTSWNDLTTRLCAAPRKRAG